MSKKSKEVVVEREANIGSASKSRSKQFNKRENMLKNFTIIVVALAIGAAVFFWNEAREAKQFSLEGVQERNLAETQQVVDKLGTILQLNNEDQPTVARVENPDVLKEGNPDFYRDAQANDYLVLYPQRAIIYRLSDNKIINIAPIINTEAVTQSLQEGAAEDN